MSTAVLSLLVLGTLLTVGDSVQLERRAVFVIMQHGVEAPRHFYPTDPLKNHHWPSGLLPQSEEFIALLAQTQSEAFQDLLANTSQLNAWTSSAKIAQDSARVYLQHLNHSNLSPVKINPMLDVPLEQCPAAQKAYDQWIMSPPVQSYLEFDSQIKEYEYLTGEKYLYVKNGVQNLIDLASTLETEKLANLTPPVWTNGLEKLSAQWRENLLWLRWSEGRLQRLLGSRLVSHLREHMAPWFSNHSQPTNSPFYFYTADVDLQTILLETMGFGFYLWQQNRQALRPQLYLPGATVVIELYHSHDDDVDLLHFYMNSVTSPRNGTTHFDTFFLEHPQCGANAHRYRPFNSNIMVPLCTWQQFEHFTKSAQITTQDWFKECHSL